MFDTQKGVRTLTPHPYKILSIHEQIANHVLKHIAPFVFGHGSDYDSYEYNSGTATLIDLGCGPLVLTCEHVATSFRQFKEIHKDKINAQLYIGGATGIDHKIIAWDEELDIATLQLTKDELSRIPNGHNLYGTKFINEVYLGPIKKNDVVVFAGFPSQPTWRYKTGIKNLFAFHPCVCFSEIVSINDDYIICQSDHIIFEKKTSHQLTPIYDPAGMSGGAAFLVCHNGINFSCSFIGVISEGEFLAQNCLSTYVMLAKRLNSDGTIRENAQ